MLPRLGRNDFFPLLGMNPATFRSQESTGDAALFGGLKRHVYHGQYLVLDAPAVLLTSMLATQIGQKGAAEVIRISWDAWLRALQVVESDPRACTEIEIPPGEQMLIGVGVAQGRAARVEVGLGAHVEAKLTLAGCEKIRGVSIHAVLRQLRVNSRLTGVALPDRLTLDFDDPRHGEWRAAIENYRQAGLRDFKERLKANRARRRPVVRMTFEMATREPV